MAKLGQGIVRQAMAEGVADLITLAHGITKLGHGLVRRGMAKGVANLTTLPTDGRTGARYSEAMYGRGHC